MRWIIFDYLFLYIVFIVYYVINTRFVEGVVFFVFLFGLYGFIALFLVFID